MGILTSQLLKEAVHQRRRLLAEGGPKEELLLAGGEA